MSDTMLPPYGVFPPRLERLANNDRAMPDWQNDNDSATRQQNYLTWRVEMRKTLSDFIWPYYDRNSRQWKGQAKNFADSGTEQEIDIMVRHLQGVQSKLDLKLQLCETTEFGDTHLEQFEVEDDPSQVAGVNIRDYVCSLSEKQFQDTLMIIDQAYDRKIQGLFWFKREFVRPRPYQTALIFGYDQFHAERAISATHSSFYSGHCVEGILFCAAVAEVWMKDPASLDAEAVNSLMRYSVDFGDRRVFAGVHYPSDNISSWYLALELIPHVFENPHPIKKFVVDALTRHSTVYQLVSAEYNDGVFEPAIQLLEGALNLEVGIA